MNRTRMIIGLTVCAVLSVAIVLGLPELLNESDIFATSKSTSSSILTQEVEGYTKEGKQYYKLYRGGELLGVISDLDYVYEKMDTIYEERYADTFPDEKITFGEDYYLSQELGYYELENIDDAIVAYIEENDGFGIRTNIVEFSTSEGVYASIAVADVNDFIAARDRFLTNFISEDSLKLLNSGGRVDTLDRVGEQVTGYRVQETITLKEGVANINNVMTDENTILDYLCFGDNKEREYYTVKEGDTLQGVGFFNGNITPTQIMLINPDRIHSVDQVLEVGMELNVTYFTSPIHVIVTKQSLREEVVYPETPLYIEDNTLYTNVSEIVQEEKNGAQYTLYEETWVNGVLATGEAVSSSIIEQPIQGIIRVGVKQRPYIGTGTFIWPVKNAIMTCTYGCYAGHYGIDINNRYNIYDKIYAADNGTVVANGYDAGGWGYYIKIDHNNGFATLYGHMSHRSPLTVGQTVVKGEYIGNVGSTGRVTGPHLHFEIYVNGSRTNPCEYMNCWSIY